MIACLRTVGVPPRVRDRYLAWISEGRAAREALPADHPLRRRGRLPQPPGPGRRARPVRTGGDIMKWVTRARPKTDRIACPWLVRRFIDPDSEILYVPKDQVLDVARQEGARSFDADGAEFTHRGDRCSFEVLIDDFGLGDDAALVR